MCTRDSDDCNFLTVSILQANTRGGTLVKTQATQSLLLHFIGIVFFVSTRYGKVRVCHCSDLQYVCVRLYMYLVFLRLSAVDVSNRGQALSSDGSVFALMVKKACHSISLVLSVLICVQSILVKYLYSLREAFRGRHYFKDIFAL